MEPNNKPSRYINKKVTYTRKVFQTQVTTKQINHEVVNYNDNKYVVCLTIFNDDNYILYLIDYEDIDKVIHKSWHFMPDGKYIGNSIITENNEKKQLYLHNLVMNKLTFDGKGQQHTIDHISRNGLDNRKCNLRFVESQSQQNYNQGKRKRITELPEDCNINPDDIPKRIYYAKPYGNHGDYFYIELKNVSFSDKKYVWKTSKSTKIPLINKFKEALDKLDELINTYPELKEHTINEDNENIRKQLINEYNDIIKLSSYPKDIIENNIIKFKSEINKKNEEIVIENKIINTAKNRDKVDISTFENQDNIDYSIVKLPKYCYYGKASQSKGSYFVIEKHPNSKDKRISTTTSKFVSDNEKYKKLLELLDDLNK